MSKYDVRNLFYKLKDKNLTEEKRKKIKTEILNINQGLVQKEANKMYHHALSTSDFIQEGFLGLMIAIDKFNVDSGNLFSTYAVYWIRQKMLRLIEKNGGIIKTPNYIKQITENIRKIQRENVRDSGDYSLKDIDELYVLLNMNEDAFKFIYGELEKEGIIIELCFLKDERFEEVLKIIYDFIDRKNAGTYMFKTEEFKKIISEIIKKTKVTLPTFKNIKPRVFISKKNIKYASEYLDEILSLNKQSENDDNSEYESTIPSDKNTEDEAVKKIMLDVLNDMGEPHREVIRSRFGLDKEPLSYLSISKKLNVNVSEIKRIEMEALKWLKKRL